MGGLDVCSGGGVGVFGGSGDSGGSGDGDGVGTPCGSSLSQLGHLGWLFEHSSPQCRQGSIAIVNVLEEDKAE